MGQAERKARDERVVELKRRQARDIFGYEEHQATMIHEIKAPLLKSLDTLISDASKLDKLKAIKTLLGLVPKMRGLPVPTKENTWHPNCHRLIEVRDWFFSRCSLDKSRMNFIWAGINFVIILYCDPPYRDLMDEVKEELEKKGWAPKGSLDLIERRWAWWKKEE